MRFLTAYYAQKEGCEVVLDGCERLRERPIAQLVDALRELGADIEYVEAEGRAPIRVRGRKINKGKVVLNDPASTQFVSALMLIGVEVETNRQSPYIEMTRQMLADAERYVGTETSKLEADWSAAAFWLERHVLGLVGKVDMPGLRSDSLQGDKAAVELFEQVMNLSVKGSGVLTYDFSACPDLYPAVAVACHELGVETCFTGLESLRLKESDRIAAVEDAFAAIDKAKAEGRPAPVIRTHADHRIAMAFLAAGYQVDDEACCAKSYPDFVMQLRGIERVVPRRGVNDDGRGKKWALHKLVPQVTSEWVWLADDDVLFPTTVPSEQELAEADMIILPLEMQPVGTGLLQDLQVLEYEAIQALTMRYAQKGRAVMCSGANLLVRKRAWMECADELHDEIASGDDMFLLEAMKRRGKRVTALHAHAATCYAEPTLPGLLRQRMRWAGKAPHYTDTDIRRVGVWTVLTNVLAAVCPVWMLGKWVVDARLILNYERAMRDTKITAKFLCETLLLTILYPWYMMICLIGGFFRTFLRMW